MKTRWVLKFLMLGAIILLFSGCNAKDEGENETIPIDSNLLNYTIEDSLKQRAEETIQDFYVASFNLTMDEAQRGNVLYETPESINNFLAKSVLETNLGKIGTPIHYPRYLDIHGLTIYDYEAMAEGDSSKIVTKFYERRSEEDVYAFLTEVELKAYVLSEEDFAVYFSRNEQTSLIQKSQEIPLEKLDFIKIKAKFDVWVKEEDGAVKIVRANESSNSRNEFRVNRLNNEFIERLPFYDTETLEENPDYMAETKLLREFFESMFLKLDKAKAQNLAFEWERDGVAFFEYMDQIGFLKNAETQNLYFTDILGDHKKVFHKDAIPIKPGMERITEIEVSFNQHPGFRNLERVYRVDVEAFVETQMGGLSGIKPYRYEYWVKVSRNAEDQQLISIEECKLNMYRLSN